MGFASLLWFIFEYFIFCVSVFKIIRITTFWKVALSPSSGII
jgi:hypothetical protein